MKTNHIIRRLLFLAALCISSSDALIRFAIDPTSCSAGGYENFLLAKLRRVSTIGKFMSLNLGNSDSQGFLRNPWKWQLDGHINDQIKLLMGDTQDAYVCLESLPLFMPWTESQVVLIFKRRRMKSDFEMILHCHAFDYEK